ncbi:trypsin-like serine peptidase [Streptosporangium sp. NPDC000509]|uniref:trypsin-like serine peptidase n=1 Tax=Streptosporangium sp. NPDC000509 TaxID=3366186 RepID=UPI0036A418B3
MTSSLPLLAAASLLAGSLSAPAPGATATWQAVTEFGKRSAKPPVHPSAETAEKAGTTETTGKPATVATSGAPDVVEHAPAPTASERERLLGYWTPRRMASATPFDRLDKATGTLGRLSATGRGVVPRQRSHGAVSRTAGARWTSGGAVARTTGRVFLTIKGSDFVCSASSVRSANKDLVVTAGHCVKDGTGAWADNWTFVPGYSQGRRPYGQYTARRMFVAGPWSREGDDSHDIGMVAVATSGGRHLGDVVGGQDIAFGVPRGRLASGFGFPADAPYDGEHLVYCAGPLRDDPNGQTRDQGMRCDMTAGSSGGPWLSGFDASTGRGTIVSVSSFKYSDDRRTMYGPYFGDSAKALYATASAS